VKGILAKHGMNRLPANQKHRAHAKRWTRYEKPPPGHRLQMDVKFLERIPGTRKRLYQFTAIDDYTRIRVLKVYHAYNQTTAIQFADDVVLLRLPFRVLTSQTDKGAEFQSRFHWHLEAPQVTLLELGITKKVSSIAQQLAALPPETREAIARRETSMSQARRAQRAAGLRRGVPLPTDKYRILYADPPRSYNDKADGDLRRGGAGRHYPTMTIKELCELPVAELCENPAVLFLWVTSPLLFESQAVFRAWGFDYRGSFVWDKVKHNMGHYNSVRHEFLLVCTRGNCPPDVSKLFDSVQSIARTTHSTKPEAFRAIIDTLYPYGRRIELFARHTRRNGWDAWGNEAYGGILAPAVT